MEARPRLKLPGERPKATFGPGFWAAFLAGAVWCLYRLLSNQGWIQDDELAHYLISKAAWSDFGELWHPWSRPGRNLLEFWLAPFGLTATRFWTLGLSMFAVWVTVLEGRRLQLPHLWALPLLLMFQWWFAELSYPVLTQAPFMLVWIGALALAVREKYVLAALAWGYLGLVRHEGVALTALWGLWAISRPEGFLRLLLWRDVGGALRAFPEALKLGFFTVLPMVLMNLFTWLTRGEVPFLMFFESKPTDYYGSGPWWLYLRHLVTTAGLPVVLLAMIGLFWSGWKKDWNLALYLTFPFYLALHSFIYWKGMFASGGYYHFIMPMAPALALWALAGFAMVKKRTPQWVSVVILIAVVWTGLMIPQQQFVVPDGHIEELPEIKGKEREWIAPPMPQSRIARGAEQAADWVKANVSENQHWWTHYVTVSFYLQDFNQDRKIEGWTDIMPEKAKLGTVLIWDALYSVDTHGFTLERLKKAGWEEKASFAYGTVRVFEKLARE